MNSEISSIATADTVSDFARILQADKNLFSGLGSNSRLELDEKNVKNGLGRLALTIIKLLHELLERQAIRRIESETLDDESIERLGVALMRQTQEIDKLRLEFGLQPEDLNLDLGPLGKLL